MLQFKSDESKHYINLTDPVPGSYFAAAFLSYSDPKNEHIKQDGKQRSFILYISIVTAHKQTAFVSLWKDDIYCHESF